MKKLTALLLALALSACVSTDYQFGDLSKALGITVPVDYCATVGLVKGDKFYVRTMQR
jgi:hypothetical protein